MHRIALALLMALAAARAAAPAVEQGMAAAAAAAAAATTPSTSSRRHLLIASCVGTGGTNCLELQPSAPVPLPTDQLTLVAAELAELAYPGEQCSSKAVVPRKGGPGSTKPVVTGLTGRQG